MMRTFSARLRAVGRSSIGRPARAVRRARGRLLATRAPLASETGDTLIEVLVSAILIALIVVAMFNGFNVTSRASASERSRAQANALAQQAEDRLRSFSVTKLSTLLTEPVVEEVKQNGTKYKITSIAEYVKDETATSSCNSSSSNPGYYRTISTVTWASLGARKPVTETGIISPPPGSALTVQVTDESATGVAGMSVNASGPAPATSPHELTTAPNGCATLALSPGEYKINVSKPNYVDNNWYEKSEEDPHATHSVYVVAETAPKVPYSFALAGTLQVEFETESAKSEGDSFVAATSQLPTPGFKEEGEVQVYKKMVEAPKTVFPFKAPYTVYAGTCEANNPTVVNPENKIREVTVPPGGTEKVTVIQPPINIRVMSGKAGAEGVKVENATGTLVEPKHEESAEHSGCGDTRKFPSTPKGALLHPGMPFGEYTLCVTAAKRKYTTPIFENSTPAGPTKPELEKIANGGVVKEGPKNVAVIYMGSGAAAPPGGKLEESGTEC